MKAMSTRQKKILWPLGLLLLALLALAFISVMARTSKVELAKVVIPNPPQTSSPAQSRTKAKVDYRAQLARQPFAFRLAMQLGKRFRSPEQGVSVLTGKLRIGTDENPLRIVRRQTDSGESVEIALGSNGRGSMTWSAEDGVKFDGGAVSDADRLIAERLILDSPDQFILAQLRGASYQVINRNVRPAEAGGSDDYQGPNWDIVRVAEPSMQRTPGGQSVSVWRLYWINVSTGLIDKIVSSEDGQEVTASLSWAEQGQEKVPSHITWTRQGQTLMQLDFNGFNYSANQSQQ
jgi:hypothetical protein